MQRIENQKIWGETSTIRIFVLGGAGYIGPHTVYELSAQGNEVVAADNLETGHVEAVHKDAVFYQGDRT